MKTRNTNRIVTAAVALVCAGFVGMSYATAQTPRSVSATSPGRIFDLSGFDIADPPDDNLAEQAREVTKVVQELVREAEKRRVQAPGGGNGWTTFPGLF